jgi:hypothetical protein
MNSIRRAKSDSGMKYLFKAKHTWTGLCLAVAGFTALIAATDKPLVKR